MHAVSLTVTDLGRYHERVVELRGPDLPRHGRQHGLRGVPPHLPGDASHDQLRQLPRLLRDPSAGSTGLPTTTPTARLQRYLTDCTYCHGSNIYATVPNHIGPYRGARLHHRHERTARATSETSRSSTTGGPMTRATRCQLCELPRRFRLAAGQGRHGGRLDQLSRLSHSSDRSPLR